MSAKNRAPTAATAPMASFKTAGEIRMPSFVATADSLVKSPARKAAPFLAARRRLIQRYRSHDNESHAKQLPPHREECPEDAGVADLPHPEPLLYHAGDERQDSDERDRSDNHQVSLGAPPLGVLSGGGGDFRCRSAFRPQVALTARRVVVSRSAFRRSALLPGSSPSAASTSSDWSSFQPLLIPRLQSKIHSGSPLLTIQAQYEKRRQAQPKQAQIFARGPFLTAFEKRPQEA